MCAHQDSLSVVLDIGTIRRGTRGHNTYYVNHYAILRIVLTMLNIRLPWLVSHPTRNNLCHVLKLVWLKTLKHRNGETMPLTPYFHRGKRGKLLSKVMLDSTEPCNGIHRERRCK